MLLSGTFTKAVMYLMLLSDSIIAGFFIGPSGVAGINAITPVTAVVTFFGDLCSTGVGIVSCGFTFCSLVSLTTSYYMLIDHIGMATCIACFQNGLLYILLPICGAFVLGAGGMWAGFAAAPILTILAAMVFVYLRFGKDNFPFILNKMESEIIVIDDILTKERVSALSENVGSAMSERKFGEAEAYLVTTGYNRNMIRFIREKGGVFA